MKDVKKSKDASRKEEDTASSEKRSPVKSFREGEVAASIFRREVEIDGEERLFHSVSFTRSYKDGEGRYQYAKSFDPDDLGKVVSVAKQATEYLQGLEESEARK